MITYVLFALVALSVAIPIIGSFAICVPKWWKEVISPHVPVSSISMPDADITRWYWTPFRLMLALIGLVVFVPVAFGIKYWHSVAALIERKCPYTSPEIADEIDSYQQQAERFKGEIPNTFKGLWGFILGR